MTYKIIGDSCLDLTEKQQNDPHFALIPLSLQVGDFQTLDDENFNQSEFLKIVKESTQGAKTGCPSPELFREAYRADAENIFVVTLSKNVSGTYDSAELGKRLYLEKYGPKNIFVLSSHSASAGELRIALEIQRLCEQDLPFDEICGRIIKFRDEMKTLFVLESLDTLKKNGRLSGLTAFIATALNIKPVMSARDGKIIKLDQARGIQKAILKMIEYAKSYADGDRKKTAVIAHVNNKERGEFIKKAIEETKRFKEVILCKGAGVTTVYAGDSGIVMGIG